MPRIEKKQTTGKVERIAKQVGKRTIKRKRSSVKEESRRVDPSQLVPTPCIPFNLECSGHWQGAFQLGTVVNLIGDSHAGKTLFALSIFAECAMDKRFDGYRFIYDDVESANAFDMEYLFGKKCADRVETDEENSSDLFEEFSDRFNDALDDDRPCIYILDSADALNTEAAEELEVANRKLREAGKESKGAYGDGKAKLFSAFFKSIKRKLARKKSLLLIISQTRDNIGFGSQFTPKTRSGGKALKFYSFHEIWLAMEKKIKKGDRTFITNVQAKITKNKLTGRHGVARFPILFDYGVDNITSSIEFLIKEKEWSKTTKIDTKGFYPSGPLTQAALIKWIEEGGFETELAEECKKCYDRVINGLKPVNRKRKYC